MDDDNRTLLMVAAVVGLLVVGSIVAVIGVSVVGSFVISSDESTGEVGEFGPEVSLTADRNGGQVTINHTGGDALDPELVVVTVGNDSATWLERGGDGELIEEGDSLTVDAADGTRIEIVYRGEEDVTLLSVEL